MRWIVIIPIKDERMPWGRKAHLHRLAYSEKEITAIAEEIGERFGIRSIQMVPIEYTDWFTCSCGWEFDGMDWREEPS